jgi:hypothetical protein
MKAVYVVDSEVFFLKLKRWGVEQLSEAIVISFPQIHLVIPKSISITGSNFVFSLAFISIVIFPQV